MRCYTNWKRALSVLIMMLFASSLFAVDGGLEMGTIEKIRSDFQMDTHTRAMYNAITNTDIKGMALNRDLLRQHNELFSHKIDTKGVTNQKSSGRCWLFAGLNIMRPAVIEQYKLGKFEFSQNYLAFYDKLEKANTFYEQIIEYADRPTDDRVMEILLRSPYGDGGWWRYVVDLIEKYGVVPKEIMPETNSSSKTGYMNRLISQKLRADAITLRTMHQDGKSLKKIRAAKEEMLAGVYRMLVMNLGEPPTEFDYRYESKDNGDDDSTTCLSELTTYTPKSFYQEFVGVDLQEYVSIFDHPCIEYGNHYTISMSRNMYDKNDINFANVDVQILKEIALASVLDDEPLWFACDVGRDQDTKNGIMAMDIYDFDPIYNTDMEMSKAERVLYRQSSPNHAMVFLGVDMKDDKPVKWLVENSWGDERGSDGFWTLYDTWFDNHVFNIIVKKEYVPEDVLSIYDKDPIVLPPWDPMFQMLR